MDDSRPVKAAVVGPAPGDEWMWRQPFDQEFYAHWLDDRRGLELGGIDPDAHIVAIRATGDKMAVRRGLVFAYEFRQGAMVMRRYVVAARQGLWDRLWYRFAPRRWREQKPQSYEGR